MNEIRKNKFNLDLNNKIESVNFEAETMKLLITLLVTVAVLVILLFKMSQGAPHSVRE